jgi:hypothetical protein
VVLAVLDLRPKCVVRAAVSVRVVAYQAGAAIAMSAAVALGVAIVAVALGYCWVGQRVTSALTGGQHEPRLAECTRSSGDLEAVEVVCECVVCQAVVPLGRGRRPLWETLAGATCIVGLAVRIGYGPGTGGPGRYLVDSDEVGLGVAALAEPVVPPHAAAVHVSEGPAGGALFDFFVALVEPVFAVVGGAPLSQWVDSLA